MKLQLIGVIQLVATPVKKMSSVHERRQGEDSVASAWSPLHNSVFRALWIATVASNVGSWMQDVGESWLMTSSQLTGLVALVETAGSLPVGLVALLRALADIVRRRRLLLVMRSGWPSLTGARWVLLRYWDMVQPLLLSLTFSFRVGTSD